VGLGAVATTFIAGVELARRGKGKPFGSLTQMGTIRLGKRTDHRSPLIKDFVSLARLEDLVFAPGIRSRQRVRAAHVGAGQMSSTEPIGLPRAKPMPAVFDQHYAWLEGRT
jgi:myo-inositol-1-phosphate synthase